MGGGPYNLPCIAGYENYTRLKTEVDSSAELLMQAVRKPSGEKKTEGLYFYFFIFFSKFVFWLIVLALSLVNH